MGEAAATCKCCGRRGFRLKVARGPNGKLVYHWCDDCLYLLHRNTLGIPVEYSSEDLGRKDNRAPDPALHFAERRRIVGMRLIGLILACWGLVLEIVAVAYVFLGRLEKNSGFGPSRLPKSPIFLVAGAALVLIGGWLGLISVDRTRRRRSVALVFEVISLVVGFGALVYGILFYDTKRNILIMEIVGVAAIVAVGTGLERRKRRGKTSISQSLLP